MKIKHIALIVFIFWLSDLSAQEKSYTQTIRGVVIDNTSKSPIPRAHIVVLQSKPLIRTVSDNNGEFILKNVPIGRQDISTGFMGYQPSVIRNLLVKSAKEIVLKIKLEEIVITTDEVVVKAYGRKDKPNLL